MTAAQRFFAQFTLSAANELRITASTSFSAACFAPPFRQHPTPSRRDERLWLLAQDANLAGLAAVIGELIQGAACVRWLAKAEFAMEIPTGVTKAAGAECGCILAASVRTRS